MDYARTRTLYNIHNNNIIDIPTVLCVRMRVCVSTTLIVFYEQFIWELRDPTTIAIYYDTNQTKKKKKNRKPHLRVVNLSQCAMSTTWLWLSIRDTLVSNILLDVLSASRTQTILTVPNIIRVRCRYTHTHNYAFVLRSPKVTRLNGTPDCGSKWSRVTFYYSI